MKSPEMLTAEIIEKIIQAAKTPTSEWLANLPQFDCPICGQKTIFTKGCVDCTTNEVQNVG